MQARTKVVLGAVAVAALARLVPHPPNFAPLTALALFGGAYLSRKWLAFLVPLTALVISDLALEGLYQLGFYQWLGSAGGWLGGGRGFHSLWWAVYGAFLIVAGIGMLLGRRPRLGPTVMATLCSSLVFFLLTNFAVWAIGTDFEKTPMGLALCYAVALPFFGWPLLGDAIFVTILFGGFALAQQRYPALRPASATPAVA